MTRRANFCTFLYDYRIDEVLEMAINGRVRVDGHVAGRDFSQILCR